MDLLADASQYDVFLAIANIVQIVVLAWVGKEQLASSAERKSRVENGQSSLGDV